MLFFKRWFGRDKDESIEEVKAIVISDIGQVRTNNEDNGVFIKPSWANNQMGYLAVVADGMGGHQAGEVASRMATEIIRAHYYKKKDEPKSRLLASMVKANKDILNKAKDNTSLKGMGTTCTAAAIINERVIVGHIGDSRLYHLKNGRLKQVTTDHTYVQELLRQGIIGVDEVENHPNRNILTRVMGTKANVEFEVFEMNRPFEQDDKLLLCSDGLYDYFTIEELEEYMIASNIGKTAQNLVEMAKQRGGHDNITVIVIEKTQPAIANEQRKETREIKLR